MFCACDKLRGKKSEGYPAKRFLSSPQPAIEKNDGFVVSSNESLLNKGNGRCEDDLHKAVSGQCGDLRAGKES